MTDGRMALPEPIGKGADADLVRDLVARASERSMAVGVEQPTGAAAGARSPGRTDHRERGWVARAGRIGPAVPKCARAPTSRPFRSRAGPPRRP